MEKYIFVCIGTNKIIEDSFGPMVGNILTKNFNNNKNIKVFGTMNYPVHFKNAPIFAEYLKQEKSQLILIDSALGEAKNIGNTYINFGGLEIGKALKKSFYFPAHLNITTVVDSINDDKLKIDKIEKYNQIQMLAQKLASQIIQTVNSIC